MPALSTTAPQVLVCLVCLLIYDLPSKLLFAGPGGLLDQSMRLLGAQEPIDNGMAQVKQGRHAQSD
jgi:hypothetical protein